MRGSSSRLSLAAFGGMIAGGFCGHVKVAAQAQEPPPVPSARIPPPGPYLPGFDALHYQIALTLPATGDRISASARIAIAIRAPRRDTLRLDLSGLLVTAARAAVGRAAPATVAYRQDDGRVFLSVPAARAGDTLHVEIDYEGTPDDGLIIGQNVHGARTAFADDYPDRARFWFPSIDHPSDKATVSYEVRAPAGWEVIANGRRMGSTTDHAPPADRIWRWETSAPIPTYTMVIGAADFAVGEVDRCARGGANTLRPDECVAVTYWVFPRDSANAARIFRRAGQMIKHYAQLFGPFPYEKLAHVQSATRYGGMENVGAIFYSEQSIASGGLGEVTIAHETAHQWFGDAVTPANWHHVWLSEGFATYFGMQFFEKADGASRFRELLAGSANGYLRSRDSDLPMVDTTRIPGAGDLNAVLNRNSYNKGGQVLHMLRGLLGDDAFFSGLRDYFARYQHSNARTADLQRALEQASRTDLGWFFEQWAYRPGHPIFRVSHEWSPGTREVVVSVDQVQKEDWPTFRMPIEFAFETAQGTVRRKAEVSGRRATLRFPMPAAPARVILDPDGWVLKEVRND
jgi:aminopeptidase N